MTLRRAPAVTSLLLVAACAAGSGGAPPTKSPPAAKTALPPLVGGGNRVLVEESSSIELFADEDRDVRAGVAAWLAQHTPWTIVPPEQIETVRARAVEGRDLATGAACGAPIHAHDAYARVFGTSDTADISVECKTGCDLVVTAYRHPPGMTRDQKDFYDAAASYVFRAPISGKPTKSTMVLAIPKLARAPESEDDEGGLGGLAMGGRAIRRRATVRASLWPASDPSEPKLDDALLNAIQPELDRCYAPGENQEMLLLATDAKGRVTRCEPRPWAPSPSRACACAAMGHVAWPAREARVAFDVVHEHADVEIARDEVVLAYVRDYGKGPGNVLLARCFAQDAPATKETATVTYRVGDDAHPSDLKITWPDAASPKSATRACVENAFRAAVFPCHERGTAVSTALSVERTKATE